MMTVEPPSCFDLEQLLLGSQVDKPLDRSLHSLFLFE